MKGYALRSLLWFGLFACGTSSADAQDQSETRSEFWPEIGVYLHPSTRFRLFFLGRVSRAREGAKIFGEEPYEGYTGAHLDFIPNKNVIPEDRLPLRHVVEWQSLFKPARERHRHDLVHLLLGLGLAQYRRHPRNSVTGSNLLG